MRTPSQTPENRCKNGWAGEKCNELDTPIIAGIATAGVVVFLAAVILTAFCCRRKVAGNKNVPVRRLSGHDNDSYDIGPMENLFPQNTHVNIPRAVVSERHADQLCETPAFGPQYVAVKAWNSTVTFANDSVYGSEKDKAGSGLDPDRFEVYTPSII